MVIKVVTWPHNFSIYQIENNDLITLKCRFPLICHLYHRRMVKYFLLHLEANSSRNQNSFVIRLFLKKNFGDCFAGRLNIYIKVGKKILFIPMISYNSPFHSCFLNNNLNTSFSLTHR